MEDASGSSVRTRLPVPPLLRLRSQLRPRWYRAMAEALQKRAAPRARETTRTTRVKALGIASARAAGGASSRLSEIRGPGASKHRGVHKQRMAGARLDRNRARSRGGGGDEHRRPLKPLRRKRLASLNVCGWCSDPGCHPPGIPTWRETTVAPALLSSPSHVEGALHNRHAWKHGRQAAGQSRGLRPSASELR